MSVWLRILVSLLVVVPIPHESSDDDMVLESDQYINTTTNFFAGDIGTTTNNETKILNQTLIQNNDQNIHELFERVGKIEEGQKWFHNNITKQLETSFEKFGTHINNFLIQQQQNNQQILTEQGMKITQELQNNKNSHTNDIQNLKLETSNFLSNQQEGLKYLHSEIKNQQQDQQKETIENKIITEKNKMMSQEFQQEKTNIYQHMSQMQKNYEQQITTNYY
jgi:hypothetical protein